MYKKKLLFKNTNANYEREASAVESVWAYLISSDPESKRTGRFRIRITKMSAAELVAMGLAPEQTPADYYGLQASLDKWNESVGWIALFDWVGDPNAEIYEIERDLCDQFEAFVTGISSREAFSFNPPKPPKEKKPKATLPTTKDDSEKIEEEPSTTNESDSEPDFEWL